MNDGTITTRVLSVFVSLACFASIAVSDEVPLGMWSWQQESFQTPAARTQMIQFCKEHRITHICQHVSTVSKDGKPGIANAEPLKQLILLAADNDITISALRGEPNMFFAKRMERRKEKLILLVEFNRGLPDGYSLDGIQYDVEPYLTKEWKAGGEKRRKVVEDYLACLDMIGKELKNSGSTLKLGVDVPFWWDKPEHTYQYDGKDQSFVHHIQDRVDSLNLMSYRRTAKDVIRFAKDELAYAKKNRLQQSVGVGLNFAKQTGSEKVTTFAGHPVSMFKTAMAELQEKLSDAESVQRIMLHDYRTFARYVK